MYNPITKVWSEVADEDWKEHFETTYYLNYNIEKTIFSLNKLLLSKIDYSEFSNRCTYYHFYIDNLINSIEHIGKRFSYNTRASIDTKRENPS